MKKIGLLLAAAFILSGAASAQEAYFDGAPNWYVGLTEGYKATFPHFSDIDKDYYPNTTSLSSGVYGLFVQGEFGQYRQLAIRPEILFTRRGGGLKNIGSNLRDYAAEGIDDVTYKIRSGYFDVRVPLIYNFGDPSWSIRPYVYVAPVLGFATGGKIRLQELTLDSELSGYEVDINEANYASTYFAGALAVGARYHFPLASSVAFAGLELMYEHGFTDTYGSKEKQGDAVNVNPMFPVNAIADGTRKYNGVEVKLTLGIPFDVFGGARQVARVDDTVVEVYDYEEITREPEEKPCYSLNEIVDMMARGVNVEGKTICAIDDDINFDFAKSEIKPSSYGYLDRLAETLIRTNAHIVVKGHTDNIGPEEVNLKLSKERALNVTQYLRDKGVPSSRLSTEYYGMSRPIATNDTEEGRARNRRVEFEILNN